VIIFTVEDVCKQQCIMDSLLSLHKLYMRDIMQASFTLYMTSTNVFMEYG